MCLKEHFQNIKAVIVLSKISFQTFCVEHYSQHIQKDSTEVYKMFVNKGVLDLLSNDYEDLHGMGMEYLMQFIDEYLGVMEE